MAKYGMSMCVLGMAEEFRGQIAVNALWPRTGQPTTHPSFNTFLAADAALTPPSVATAIQTAAMDMLGGDGIGKQCRTADIMADAAYAVLTRPKDYTGQFLVDEDVLKKEGILDFDPYAVQPGRPRYLRPGVTWSSWRSVPGHQVTRCCPTSSWTKLLRIWSRRWRSTVKTNTLNNGGVGGLTRPPVMPPQGPRRPLSRRRRQAAPIRLPDPWKARLKPSER